MQNTKQKDKSLVLKDVFDNQFIQEINKGYPTDIKEGFSNIINIIDSEKHLTDLYPDVLSEIPISTSLFQDKCVQYESNHTPHRKLRQAMLEMQNRLDALYTAKTGHKKSIFKVLKLENAINDLKEDIENETNERKKKKLELELMLKEIKLEEAKRGVNSSSHLIKDAMLKVVQQQKLVEEYKKEVKESNLSFEESELVYYVMYFTKDAEMQLRTNGRIDTGTFGAISQLPEGLRKKVLNNISFIRTKLFEENWPIDGDYLYKVYRDVLEPKKTGEDEIEGVSVKEFISVNPIKVLE